MFNNFYQLCQKSILLFLYILSLGGVMSGVLLILVEHRSNNPNQTIYMTQDKKVQNENFAFIMNE